MTLDNIFLQWYWISFLGSTLIFLGVCIWRVFSGATFWKREEIHLYLVAIVLFFSGILVFWLCAVIEYNLFGGGLLEGIL